MESSGSRVDLSWKTMCHITNSYSKVVTRPKVLPKMELKLMYIGPIPHYDIKGVPPNLEEVYS